MVLAIVLLLFPLDRKLLIILMKYFALHHLLLTPSDTLLLQELLL